jgi:DNA invertase Pin-like site-specific DNA recombinase
MHGSGARCPHDCVWADTTTAHGRYSDRARWPAEFEREHIRSTSGERRERAQAVMKYAPKLKLTLHQQQQARRRKGAGPAVREIACSYRVSPNTISRLST